MLIALMASTYDKTNEHKSEWIRQWAKMALALEQSLNKKERLKQQNRYSHLLNNGEKAFIVKWKQTDFEKEEFQKDFKNFNSKYIFNDKSN